MVGRSLCLRPFSNNRSFKKMNPQFAEIAQGFCAQYYQTFDTDRSQLAPMYNAGSIFTFEGIQIMGQEAIMQHLCQVRARAPLTNLRQRGPWHPVPQLTRQGL